MMGPGEILLVALALAMDCFTVSTAGGMIVRRLRWAPTLRMALLFGLFQGLMPLLGWLGIHYFQDSLTRWDHWIAFGLLLGIGLKMIRDAFAPEEAEHFDPERLRTQLLLAVATSIDALAVGITMSCSGYDRLSTLWGPLGVIGAVSFLMSLAGSLVGERFGDVVSRRFKPELIGGIILIGIGVKILIEHLSA